ncbi:site-specific integrase [Paenibacillus psychroresistens]|uniref:Site-specific integrase n=1 Tax=Paenibacillus psychroresistens TaxID=1778678 RepID=A0A6B8RQK0_9BACL|nr:tyrosine-type recombinase/integrase [Paenibacillus psychroresistens]QGQ97568.1 site-specific integrase [Paenibacillus psychroresistens]
MARAKKYPGIYERNDTNGKSYYFMFATIDPTTGRRKQKKYGGFTNHEDAYMNLTGMKNDQHKGIYLEPSRMPLKQWLLQWLDEKELSLKSVTLQSYRARINLIIKFIGGIELNQVNKDLIHNFYKELKLSAVTKIINDKTSTYKLSSRTIYDTHKVLKMALSQAYKDDIIPKNISFQLVSPKVNKKNYKVLKPEEVKPFLIGASDDPFFCIFYLAITIGLRQAEILGLKWNDIDFHRLTMRITRTLDNEDEENSVSDGTKSSAGTRPIEIDNEIILVLLKQKGKVEQDKKLHGDLYQDLDLVCPTGFGTPVNPSNLRRSLNKIIKATKITKITFHELRHSFATHSLIAGVDVKILSLILGHSSTRITQDIYQHYIDGMQADSFKKYRALMASIAANESEETEE